MGGVRHLKRPIAHYELVVLEARRMELRRVVEPFARADEDIVTEAIADMFAGFRTMRQSGPELVATLASVMGSVLDLPPWAIAEGCRVIKSGKVPLSGHSPHDNEIAGVIRTFVAPWAAKLKAVEAVLVAPVDGDVRANPLPKPEIDPLAAQIGRDPRGTSRG